MRPLSSQAHVPKRPAGFRSRRRLAHDDPRGCPRRENARNRHTIGLTRRTYAGWLVAIVGAATAWSGIQDSDPAAPLLIHESTTGAQLFLVPEQPGNANCYALVDPAAKQAAVIDPGGRSSQAMADYLRSRGIRVRYVLITHAHTDHVSHLDYYLTHTQADVVIHPVELQLLRDRRKSNGHDPDGLDARGCLLRTDEQTIEFAPVRLKALLIPGHTLASLAYSWVGEDIVFSGDALFRGSIGRTDLPGNAGEACLVAYIRAKLLSLDDRVRVLPGHGASTTIGRERTANPFLRDERRTKRPAAPNRQPDDSGKQ